MLTASATSVDEGASVDVSLADGMANTDYAYTITGVDEADIDLPLTGTFTTDANGAFTGSIAAIADNLTEGTETMTVSIDGTNLSTDIAINDTSKTPPLFTLTEGSDQIGEGETNTYTVTLTEAATEDTTVTFQVAPGDVAAANQGTNTTNLNDFGAGAFNPVTATIKAGSTTATFDVTALTDGITELPENYSVSATVNGVTTSETSTVLDGGAAGQTFTLTNSQNQTTGGIDNIVGTAGNDLIVGSVDATNPSYSLIDNISGGAGSDTLNVTLSANSDAVNVSEVETLLVRSTGGMWTFDATGVTGAEVITSNSSTSALNVTGVTSLSTGAGMKNTSSNMEVLYNSGLVSGTTDAAMLTVNNVTNGANFQTDGIETLNVMATGANSKLGIVGSDNDGAAGAGGASVLKTLNVSGDKSLEITTALDASVTKVDASAQTAGGVKVGITAGADVDVLGGAGNDQFSFLGATNLTSTDKVDGGTGIDRLIVDDNDLTLAQAAGVKNVEEIEAQVTAAAAATATIDASLAGVTTLIADLEDTDEGAGLVSAVFNNVSDSQVLEVVEAKADTGSVIDGANAANVTVEHANDTTTNTFTANLAGIGNTNDAAAANQFGVNVLKVDDAETLTIGSNANSNGTVTKNLIVSVESADAKTINVTGSSELQINGITAANTTLLDASAATGKLNITFDSAKDREIKLGEANDTLVVGDTDSKVTVSGGKGDDKISFQGDNITSDDKIDGGEGTDTLVLRSDFVVNDLATAANITGFSNLEKVEMANDQDLTINDAFLSAFSNGDVTITRGNGGADQFVNAAAVLNSSSKVTVDGSSQTGAGALNYVGSNGIDIFTGTKNVDTVSMTELTLKSTDTFEGGDDADVFFIDIEGPATGTTTVSASQLAGVSSFSVLRVEDSSGAEKIGVTLDDAFVAANQASNALTIQAADAGGNASDDLTTIDASGVTNSNVALTITGGGAVDTLKAGAGADILTGGTGNDVLTGGAGKDDFKAGAAGDTSTDRITDIDFGTGTGTANVDQLDLSALNIASVADVDRASANPVTVDGNTDVLILDTAAYADAAAAEDAVNASDATGEIVVIWQNSLGQVFVSRDDDAEANSGGFENTMFQLDGVTVTGIAGLIDSGDFII